MKCGHTALQQFKKKNQCQITNVNVINVSLRYAIVYEIKSVQDDNKCLQQFEILNQSKMVTIFI